MKTCPRCGSKKFWQLSSGQIRCSHCGLTRKVSKNLWKKTRISPYWKGRLVEYFCLDVPAYRLRFQIPYSQPTILRWFRMPREAIYRKTMIELKPLYRSIPEAYFHLYLKEVEWRFNHRHYNLVVLLRRLLNQQISIVKERN